MQMSDVLKLFLKTFHSVVYRFSGLIEFGGAFQTLEGAKRGQRWKQKVKGYQLGGSRKGKRRQIGRHSFPSCSNNIAGKTKMTSIIIRNMTLMSYSADILTIKMVNYLS